MDSNYQQKLGTVPLTHPLFLSGTANLSVQWEGWCSWVEKDNEVVNLTTENLKFRNTWYF